MPLLTKLTDDSDKEKLRVIQLTLSVERLRSGGLHYDTVPFNFNFEFEVLEDLPANYTRVDDISSAMESLITASALEFEKLRQTVYNIEDDPLIVIGTVAFLPNPGQQSYFTVEKKLSIPESDADGGLLLTSHHLRSAYEKIKEDNDSKEYYTQFLTGVYD